MRPPPRLCRAPASCCASSQSICSMAPIPAVRQKRSKELSTSCQAVSRLGTSVSDEGVLIVVMALLSLCGFETPSLTAQGGQRLLPNSTATGAIPPRGGDPKMMFRSRTAKRTLLAIGSALALIAAPFGDRAHAEGHLDASY